MVLLIVLAFLVLLTGMTVADLTRTATDRQAAHGSLNDARADQLARSALDKNHRRFPAGVFVRGIVAEEGGISPAFLALLSIARYLFGRTGRPGRCARSAA